MMLVVTGDMTVSIPTSTLLLLLLPVLLQTGSGQVTVEYDWVETECPPADAQMMVNQVPWGVAGRAYLTVPPGIRIAPSRIKGAGFGVFSDTLIRKYTWLGDYDGEIVPKKFSRQLSWYAWQVRRSLEVVAYTDGYHFHLSSYHRYFNSPNRHVDANVIFLECYGKVFYMTNKDIAPGDELLIFYGAGYSLNINIDLNEYYDTSSELLTTGFNMNNQTHRDWVDEAGLEHYQMRSPPPSFLHFFSRKNSRKNSV